MNTKICRQCGKELPLSMFKKAHLSNDGYAHICRDCKKGIIEDNPLSVYQPRELIEELQRRGIEGELRIIQKVKV